MLDAKKEFRKCGTCSRTFAHILNTEFGHPNEAAERAVDHLAGGLLNSGHQCGMLWGSVLAVGNESFRKFEDKDQAIAAAIHAAQEIMASFSSIAGSCDCRDITGYNLNSKWDLFKFMFKVTLQGMDNSKCFNLADKWAPEAIQTAHHALSKPAPTFQTKPISCASKLAEMMSATEEEAITVSAFAGGMGLSGNACGALSAAIWLRILEWCRENPGKTPAYFNNYITTNLFQIFKRVTEGEMRCDKITGRSFTSLDDHSVYIKNGGCKELMETLAHS